MVEKNNQALHKLKKFDGLVYSNISNGNISNKKTVIDFGDKTGAYYESLLKQWLQIHKPPNHP